MNIKIKKGFSLVEILIVIAIAVIMVGVVYASSINDDKAQKDLDSASFLLTSILRQMQTEAVTGRQISDGGSPEKFYSICRVSSDSLAANLAAKTFGYKYIKSVAGSDCNASNGTLNGPSTDFSKYHIELLVSGGSSIEFNMPAGDLNQVSDVKILLTSQRDTDSLKTVCVCKYGNIAEQKGSAECSTLCK